MSTHALSCRRTNPDTRHECYFLAQQLKRNVHEHSSSFSVRAPLIKWSRVCNKCKPTSARAKEWDYTNKYRGTKYPAPAAVWICVNRTMSNRLGHGFCFNNDHGCAGFERVPHNCRLVRTCIAAPSADDILKLCTCAWAAGADPLSACECFGFTPAPRAHGTESERAPARQTAFA